MDVQGRVDISVADGIGTVEFFHPKANSLPSNLLSKLAKAIDELGDREDVRTIVLQSAGEKAFCAGASFEELKRISNEQEGADFFSGFAHVILAMKSVPKFLLCRVQGKVVGGGVGLVAASDYVVATEAAAIRLSEFELGIGPFVVGPAVERKIGTAAFASMSIDTEWRTSEFAHQKGLFDHLVADIASLDQEIAKISKQFATRCPMATAKLKEACWTGTEHWSELLFDRASVSGSLVLNRS